MMRFRRPRAPASFEAAVRATRGEVQAAVEARRPPTFAPLWSAFKPEFAAAQRGKCGYCEIAVIGGQDGDVEHYAPKSELAGLGADSGTWGAESPNSSRVRGRKLVELSGERLLVARLQLVELPARLRRCNQKWKKTIFPVTRAAGPAVPPSATARERRSCSTRSTAHTRGSTCASTRRRVAPQREQRDSRRSRRSA